ncbi:MAG: response regulator transcription factor [Candidatus Sericytochromatia bacterium]|nr:response regulator transcription factor [Candidatus Tanganyikabacteria bacterium]
MELWSLGDSEHVGRALAEAARRRGWTINRLEGWHDLGQLMSDGPRTRLGHVHLDGDGLEQGTRLAATLRAGSARLGPVLVTLDHEGARARHLAWATGCSEVLVAPLDQRELDLRLEALARRALRQKPRALPLDERTVPSWIRVEDSHVRLTPSEAAILHYLARRPGRAIGAHELLATAMGYAPGEGHPDIIRTHMRRLRGKLGACRAAIVTRAGHGYRWEGSEGLQIQDGLPRIQRPGKADLTA